MNRVEILPKLPGETVPRMVDFISKLPLGVTISAAVVTASVFSGNDLNPSAIVSGAASINGTQVTQKITAGVAGATYQLIYQATGSDGNTYQLWGFFTVLPGNPQ